MLMVKACTQLSRDSTILSLPRVHYDDIVHPCAGRVQDLDVSTSSIFNPQRRYHPGMGGFSHLIQSVRRSSLGILRSFLMHTDDVTV